MKSIVGIMQHRLKSNAGFWKLKKLLEQFKCIQNSQNKKVKQYVAIQRYEHLQIHAQYKYR